MAYESKQAKKSAQWIGRPIVASVTALGLTLGALVSSSPVDAEAGAASIEWGVVASVSPSTLYGRSIAVTLSATGVDDSDAYNLAYVATAPAGVAVIAGTTHVDGSGIADPSSTQLEDGSTLFTWTNVSDLLAGASAGLAFELSVDTEVYEVGDVIDVAAQTFVSADPRMLPDLETATGSGVAFSTRLSPFDLTKSESSTEAELLRGLTDHQTVFTLSIDNNLINQTTGFSIVDHVPAGLEFLGCAVAANEMNNPCIVPSDVATVTADPDGAGPLPEDVFTRIEWDTATLAAAFGSADLPAGGNLAFDYSAAIPLRRNTQMELSDPTNDPSNNTGSLTADEEQLVGHARALGDYDGTLPSTDDDTEVVIAEDVSVHLNASSGTFSHGSTTSWEMEIESSQYALRTGEIVLTQDLPDGLDVTAAQPSPDAGFPVTNADGTLTLQWTLAGFDQANATDAVKFSTTTRTTYRATGEPVAARDAWAGDVQLATTSAVVVEDDAVTAELLISDASSDKQVGGGPIITKEIATPSPDLQCGDGSALDFNIGTAGPFGPGDNVCWRLTVDMPSRLDLRSLRVQDYLPAGLKFESQTFTAAHDANTDATFTSEGSVLTWNVGNVAASTERFQVVVHTVIDDPNAADPSDLVGNLMKARFANTAGTTFQLRDEAVAEWGEPVVAVVSGVAAINGVTAPDAPADGVFVESGDVVTSAIALENSGNRDALNVSVRHTLASNIGCGQISTISNGGACNDGNSWIQWDGLSVAAGSTLDLGYDLEVPAGITAAVTLMSTAGVRSYETATHAGGAFALVPADNIDRSLTSNTVSADDAWSIRTARPTVVPTQTTSIVEAGNNRGSQATIGEIVSYSYDVLLPKGTTFHGPATLSSAVGSRLDLVESTFEATLDGSPLPAAWTTDDTDRSIEVELPSPHVVTADADQTIRISFDAVVTDMATNVRSSRVSNSLALRWADEYGVAFQESATVRTRIVEPLLEISKVHNDGDSVIESGQIYRYDITVGNVSASRTSNAHDVVVVDTVAPQLTVLDESGQPVSDGSTVGDGRWSAADRTVTWSIASIERGTAVSLGYDVRAPAPLVANAPIAAAVEATATSVAGSSTDERNSASLHGGAGSGYSAGATDSAVVSNVVITSEVLTASATIGEVVDVAVAVIVPADTIGFDVAVIDALPVGLIYESLIDVRCDTTAHSCAAPTVTVHTNQNDVGFFLGDLTVPAADDRTITITYRTVVADVAEISAPATLLQTAVAYLNHSNRVAGTPTTMPRAASFDSSTNEASDGVSIVEPTLTIDKRADTQRSAPGATLSYSIVVTNPASAASAPAYDIIVTDAPDARLLDFTDTTNSAGVVLLDGEQADGSLSWSVPGPLQPGASVTISYELSVPSELDWTDEVVAGREVLNTADVSSYRGVGQARRALFPDRTYRDYDNVRDASVGVELDLASVSGRLWNDADLDQLRDANELGLFGASVIVTYLGLDERLGGGDDAKFTAVVGYDGVWVVSSLPGGQYTVQVDASTLPAGMIATYDSVRGADSPTGEWTGIVAEDDRVTGIDAGFGIPTESEDAIVAKNGDVWIAAVKPNGTGYVRMRTADGTWSSWYQQGPARVWAALSVNTDLAGNVWVVGVKSNGEAYVRTKTTEPGIRAGWSGWYRQGSGGWSSMSLSTDPAGNVWVVGVKADGLAYARVKNATPGLRVGWSGWTRLGEISWSGISMAHDTTGQLWLAGVTRNGAAYVLRRTVGGNMTANWSSWMRQGSRSDWEAMSLATDSEDSLWINGVKESGTAYLRHKTVDASLIRGWSSWLQLGGSKSWSSMTLTVDGADTLWIAGVKHSGTAYVRMKCVCVGIENGWSRWVQQGAANGWDTMQVVNDPANRVLLAGMKLGGTALTRTKANVPGVTSGWSGWTQHAGSKAWGTFSAHSDSWVGIHRPRNPSLETRDAVWLAPLGWVPSSDSDGEGLLYWC